MASKCKTKASASKDAASSFEYDYKQERRKINRVSIEEETS
ncbi:hypothetical protein B8V81_1485 [Paenibacillus pasadenensis]|uniref:Uncharacterized protein n=1 Tax=Paenibacillus pasadenensis TaxID=217090 RepID=A0A2N5NA69_9BACL|nr:hypothetical protein B8V81_1485 [Paenibacillus pasadenensis]